MKNKLLKVTFSILSSLLVLTSGANVVPFNASAQTVDEECCYYTIYNEQNEVLFMKGDSVNKNDEYISADNKLYVIEEVNEEDKTGTARYVENVKMPVYNISKKQDDIIKVNAATSEKRIGLYHTHNDECYNDADGTDSIYGKGGIHDVGAKLKSELEGLGINVYYDEALHLPHNSGAYTRSEETASKLLTNDLDAIFDIHRDATPRSEYITTVAGQKMSKVRIVIGSANVNSQSNKEFALNIKAYADGVYPGLIKDIYIGKGNYNQQLFERALLFEMGTNLIEKELVLTSTKYLAKTLDVVLYGTQKASSASVEDLDVANSTGDYLTTGLVGASKVGAGTKSSLLGLWITLGVISAVVSVFAIVCVCSPRFRTFLKRIFFQMFAVFKKKPKNT